MQAFQVTSKEAAPTLQEIDRPTPNKGEVLIRIRACGLNFADLLMAKGTYQDTPEPPFTLGMEVAGEVVAHGVDVTAPAIGTRVAVFGGSGGLAEYGCFPAALCVALPDAMPFETAAAFQVAYGTSHVALTHRAKLQQGETLLVTGAAGGVGLTAVELGAKLGATVIAAARGVDKLAVAKTAGAHHLIDTETADLRAEVKALGGADVVYDAVGGEQFQAALRSCKPEARMLTIGFASGEVPKIPANHLLVKNVSVLGFYWGGYLRFRPDVITSSLQELMAWYGDGKLSPHISHTLPLAQAADGLELLRSRRSTGKVVITP